MSKLFVLTALLGVLLAHSAQAGSVSFSDDRGAWQSKGCKALTPPMILPHDPETPANDLNLQLSQHNQYVVEAQEYMACVSREAQHDSASVSQIITKAAEGDIARVQAEVAASTARLEKRREEMMKAQ